MTRTDAIDLAATVGGTAHPLCPYDPDGDWYVLGETSATGARSRWELNADGCGRIVDEGSPVPAREAV